MWFTISLDCATKYTDPNINMYFKISLFYSLGKEVVSDSVLLGETFIDGLK